MSDPAQHRLSLSQNVDGQVIGFLVNDGSVGVNVCPILIAARDSAYGSGATQCKTVIKQSDPSIGLTFKIKQNGVDIFSADPNVAAGTAGGTIVTSTSLTPMPLVETADDLFTLDITSGSSAWQFTAQLE
jgi:hypothetical protein